MLILVQKLVSRFADLLNSPLPFCLSFPFYSSCMSTVRKSLRHRSQCRLQPEVVPDAHPRRQFPPIGPAQAAGRAGLASFTLLDLPSVSTLSACRVFSLKTSLLLVRSLFVAYLLLYLTSLYGSSTRRTPVLPFAFASLSLSL